MHFEASRHEDDFRAEVRNWLKKNVPAGPMPPMGSDQRAYLLAWQRRQHDGGWAGISWPTKYGGRGLSLAEQIIWYEEYAKAGAPPTGCLFVGLNHAGPTLIVNGTPAQKSEHLQRILCGDVIWCQGFSEPGAGSDLASLQMRGVVDGDHLVVSGQKIWTSYAQVADFQELLVRTDPAAQRHKGLTWIICDMRLPGITVRPIKTMTGENSFCEVFYDDVRIPLGNVVGAVNDGWRVAMSTLSFERGTSFMFVQLELAHKLERLIAFARTEHDARGRPLIERDSVATLLGTARAEVAALRAMTYMSASRGQRQAVPGPEGTMLALHYAVTSQRISRLAMDILGELSLRRDHPSEAFVGGYLQSYSHTIAGGTAEIRRNIIAERVLGLPRDARAS